MASESANVMPRLRRLLAAATPKLVRDLAFLAGGQLASKLIGFVAFAILARVLDPQGYGAVEYVVGLTVLFAMAVECGLGTIGVKRIAAARAELPLLAAQIPLARLVLALLAAPLMIAGMHALAAPTIPPALVWLYAASLLFVALNQEWLLQSAELMAHVAIAQMLRVLVFATVVLLLVRAPADVARVGLGEVAAVAVAAVYYLTVQHLKVTPLRLSWSLPQMVALMREGVAIGLAQFAWAAAQFTPLFLVGGLIGGAQVGWFGAAQRLVTSLATFSFVYHFNLYPLLARASAASSADLAALLRTSFRVTAWGAIGLALGLTLGAGPVLTLLFGARYAAAAPAFAILIWAIPVLFLSGHARWALIVAGDQTRVLYAQIAGLITVAAAGVPLVFVLGDVGAAMAAVLGGLAVWIFSHLAARRLAAAPPAFALALKPALLALGLGGAAWFTGLGPWVNAIGACVLYFVAAPLADRALIADIVRLAHAKAAVPREQAQAEG